jgi:uncharacterized protein YciU (UPF0263 family)
MDTPITSPVYNQFLDFVMENKTPAEILAFQLTDEEQERIADLLEKQDEDSLSLAEAAELQQIVLIDRMLLALRARALKAIG